jgi:hypothetical protein
VVGPIGTRPQDGPETCVCGAGSAGLAAHEGAGPGALSPPDVADAVTAVDALPAGGGGKVGVGAGT